MKTILSVLLALSFSSLVSAATDAERCEKKADAIIRKTIKSLGVKEWFNFNLDETEVIGKDYQGISILRYKTKLIINKEGFFPRATGEITLLADKSCSTSKVAVDMNFIVVEE